MFLGCAIGRRGITIQLPLYSLAKNIFLKSILKDRIHPIRWRQLQALHIMAEDRAWQNSMPFSN
jgi:hypothetical protein